MNSQPKWFKYEIAWVKTQSTTPLLAKRMPGRATEYILVFYKKQPVYNICKYHTSVKSTQNHFSPQLPYMGHSEPHLGRVCNLYTPSLPLNVIQSKIVKKKIIKTITEKPQLILEHLLKYFSNEGDTCLDFVMGSGSCGVACKTLNREFIGIELKKEHFDVCVERLE
tara:strand:- start:164 stop:664 length:501 start_codon:yes stop_codon:yes gene_type:complete